MKFLVSRMLLLVSACALVSAGSIHAQPALLERKQPLEAGGAKGEVSVPLRGRTVVLHVYLPKQILEPAALVLFSSGSGGWHQFDDVVATAIAKDGLPVCGISTHSYLTRFYTTSRPATIDQLVADYTDIINQAKAVVGIENSRPIVFCAGE